MRVSTAVLMSLAIAVSCFAASPPAGVRLTAQNAATAEGLLPPEILELYRKGEWSNPIVDWPDGVFHRDAAFDQGTRSNGAKLGLDESGTIVEAATGKPAESIIGFPFPKIDAADPRAGVKVVWNYFYALYDAGNVNAAVDIAWVGRSGLDRAATFQSSFLYYDGQQAKYRPKENPNDLLVQSLITVTGPQDLANTSFLVWRFRDAAKRDLDWSYLPALRRVRELSPANRSDGFLGSDLSQDDGFFFDGKPQDFSWKLVGASEMYRLADPYSLRGETAAKPLPDGGFAVTLRSDPIVGFESADWKGAPGAPLGAALAKRKLWIVEGTPNDNYYLYGKLQLAFDAETFHGAWSRKFSRDGELVGDYAAVAFLNRETTARDGAKEWISAPGIAFFEAINFKQQRATVTGFPLKNRQAEQLKSRVAYEPTVFDVQALSRGGR